VTTKGDAMRYSGRKFGMVGRFKELLPVAEEGEERVRLVTVLLRRAVALIRTGGEPLAAAASWGVCSIGMTLLNKRAIDKTGAPLGVVVLQMLATVLVALSQYRRLHFGKGQPQTPHTTPRTAHAQPPRHDHAAIGASHAHTTLRGGVQARGCGRAPCPCSSCA
jgi:hypothetical protein